MPFITASNLRLPDSLPDPGLLVGWSLESRRARRAIGFTYGHPLRSPDSGYLDPILLAGEGHLMTIAPTGAGKGTGCIIPALLRYPGAVIVVDPKGENVAITARHRREMGQAVIVIDPMGITDEVSDTLNPLDAIDIDEADAVDEVAVLAQALNAGALDERNRYWSNRGMHLAIGAMLQVLVEARESGSGKGNLIAVRDMINEAAADPAKLAGRMLASSHPEVQRIAHMLNIGAAETIGGIISFSQEMVDFLRGERVQANIASTSFDLDAVTLGTPLSIFLVLPPHMLESHSRLLRLWLSALISCFTRRRARPPLSTLFVLDEAAQLGELPQLRQAVTLLRGYGLQTWSFWQDASQLQLLYAHDWKTMVNNCRVLQCFGALNQVAAEGMSELTGFGNGDMVLDLGPDEMVLQLAGDQAVVARLPNYLSDPAFAGLYDSNPYHDQTRAVMPPKHAPQRMYTRPEGSQRYRPAIAPVAADDPLLAALMEP
ncbi:MAG: type IV secretory system conjugative DNA transfer family protein [Burkholderiaceae bacterium]|nr:type IV secretory system conjugative DNA transfer family protein [Burkholderiaceae bacterium]